MKMIFIISPPYSTGRTHSMSRERTVPAASGCILRRFPAASRADFHDLIRVGRVEEPRSDWRRAVAVVSERRVAEGRALYTERSCNSSCGVVQGARSSERERYARPRGPRKFALANFWGEPASRLGAQRPSTRPTRILIAKYWRL